MLTWITRAKQLADLENDDSIAAAVWKWFASMCYGELWSEISLGAADRYFETSTTVTATGAASYDEPEGHFATVRVARVIDGDGHEEPLTELSAQQEMYMRGQDGDACFWSLIDDQLYLFPNPSSGTYKWYYTQQPTDISSYADGDIVDVVTPAGEQFFIWGIVGLALAQQKKSVELALLMKEKAREQLQFQAASRNLYEPKTRGEMADDGDVVYGADGWPIR